MDAPDVPEAAVVQTLRELETVAKRLGGYAVTLNALRQVMKSQPIKSVMDVGFGGGDSLRAVADMARKNSLELALMGVDRNPMMARYAAETSSAYPQIRYITADVFDDSLLAESPDVVMSSLFCHHFDDDALVQLLQRMLRICRCAVIVNDLHRHPVAYHSIRLLTKFFSKTYLIKYDAPLSVARAFTRADWCRILAVAGIQHYSLQWRWAWRWELIIPKQ